MTTPETPLSAPIWRCLHCRGALTSEVLGLQCIDCGKHYPVICGIPILVKEPVEYLRSELALLTRTARDAKLRRNSLDDVRRDAGLTDTSIDRHRDVLDAEIARAKTFLDLLEPFAKSLESLADGTANQPGARRSGWSFDRLLPYLLRDYTNTPEFEAAGSVIGAALKRVFPDSSGKLLAFAGCGAGGMLTEVAPDFERVLGFDLTLPILAAARHLLDGKSLELALSQAINAQGRISLRGRAPVSVDARVEVAAMDVFDTAFADDSVDCVVTSFLIDLIPDPRKLADEIHRILRADGVWINYGPSGPLNALWRFDRTEGSAFVEAAGFAVTEAEAYRATYLDLSRDCPSWSFQNHMCYLTSARKVGRRAEKPKVNTPNLAEVPAVVPHHLPNANLVQRRTLGAERAGTVVLHFERIPGRVESVQIDNNTAHLMALVDGKRTVHDIAVLHAQKGDRTVEETIQDFAGYISQGLLRWRGAGSG